ncbi:MAG: ribbon-helix-helix protein, CopG family [Chloroflexi bacterium]|nr:ribbon-helix-helix protein, CopG family [Chloroflexota bacterium]
MATEKIAISLEQELLARVDEEASALGQSRSAFVAQCLRDALATREAERVLREARAIYEEIETDAELRHLHDRAQAIMPETVPAYDALADTSADNADNKAVA